MRLLFPSATNFAANAGQVNEACLKLGFNNPDKIKEALNRGDIDISTEGKKIADEITTILSEQEGLQLQVDSSTSDQLSVLLLDDSIRVDKLQKHYPSGRGVGRATRLMSLAKQVQSRHK